jgi:2-methylcitrate dehydratase PrpD
VGTALAYGQVGPTEINEDRLHDDRILALADKVHLHLDPDIQKRFPVSTLARVRIRLIDGRELVLDSIGTRGDHQTPFSEAELDQKTRRYARVLLNEEEIDELISLCKAVDDIEDIAELVGATSSAIKKSDRIN